MSKQVVVCILTKYKCIYSTETLINSLFFKISVHLSVCYLAIIRKTGFEKIYMPRVFESDNFDLHTIGWYQWLGYHKMLPIVGSLVLLLVLVRKHAKSSCKRICWPGQHSPSQ